MQRYAHIVDGVVRELVEVPTGLTIGVELFDPGFAAACVPCDETVAQGMLYDGAAFSAAPAPPPTIAAVDARRDQRLSTGYVDAATGKTWQCRPEDIARWTAIASSAGLNVLRGAPYDATTYDLIAADNSTLTLAAPDASALFEGRVMPWVSATILYARGLKDATLAGEAPDIEAGWP